MATRFLDHTYGLETPEATRDHYGRWAASYDQEIAENGYATPARIAEALWKFLPEADAPVLDFGCGTGLSGLALRAAGYRLVDGMDPSPEMLEQAKAKDAYRSLRLLDPAGAPPVQPGAYPAITGCGVLGVGAAPPETFDVVMGCLARGGYFAFSYNDHALADPGFTGKLNEWLDCGAARLLFSRHGDHLPGIDLKSTVYVIEKA